jgi:hypothetical protein
VSPLILFTQTVAGGQHYDGRQYEFELSAWHEKGDLWCYNIQSVLICEGKKRKEQSLNFPFWALPWLRQQMVKMLAEHDGTQRTGKSKWRLRIGNRWI